MEVTAAEQLGTVDRYRLLEQVGTGGMSQVYRAWDATLDREVAVKLLHPHLASKEDSRRRFSREARAVAKLRHPNILEIYDFSGDQAETAYIVTEFIRGMTLKRFAEEVGFGSPSIAALAAHSLAAAIEHAHALGIVHRDIKPENVMVREDGVLKLMDFGIARILDQGDRMTMTGTLVGSPAHMAPEIIGGKEADARADIFSLGTLLYWLCTGALPFSAPNTTAVLKKILDGDYADPRTLCPEVSDSLYGILKDTLERDPAQRLPTAEALRLRLEETLREDGLSRPAEELQKFFQNPDRYRETFRSALTLRLVEQARSSLAEGHRAKTLATVNRLFAIDAKSVEGERILKAIRGGERRRQQAATLALAAVVGVGGYFCWTAWQGRAKTSQAGAVVAAVETSTPLTSPTAPPDSVGGGRGSPSPPPAPPAAATAAPNSISTPASRLRDLFHHPHPRLALSAPAPIPAATAAGHLQLFVQPYADVFVDGEKRATGVPSFDATLPQGAHAIRLVHPDCDPWERKVDVATAGAPLRVRLSPKPAWLRVRATPEDADIMVDGVFKGTARQSTADPIRLPMGESPARSASVRVFKPGFRDVVQEVALRANGQAELHAVLEPK